MSVNCASVPGTTPVYTQTPRMQTDFMCSMYVTIRVQTAESLLKRPTPPMETTTIYGLLQKTTKE